MIRRLNHQQQTNRQQKLIIMPDRWNLALVVILLLRMEHHYTHAWTTPPTHRILRCCGATIQSRPAFTTLYDIETSSNVLITTSSEISANVDDDDDEYEYVEFDNLTEKEFVGSEWMIGTNWDNNPIKIDETWTRLIIDGTGKNIAIWGDNSKGTWTLDIPSQFLSISKENILAGKQIWACTISDYYYLQGTVRGWTYWSAAAVIGQWQAKRLGVDRDEAGTPPWFTEGDDGNNDVDPAKAFTQQV
jgi:hypothetical protein